MSDHSKLQELAGAAIQEREEYVAAGEPGLEWNRRRLAFQAAADPVAVLELIAENKELAHEVTVVDFQKKILGDGLRKDRVEIERLKASLSAPESVTADPAADYDALRKQFLALRTLANSNARMVSHWRNQCGAETREALLANADNVSAERDTNQLLTDALLSTEEERDQLKAENERLRKLPTCWSEVIEQSEANDQLLDQVLELSADANRYRFIVDCPIRTMVALSRKATEADFDLSAECDQLMRKIAARQ